MKGNLYEVSFGDDVLDIYSFSATDAAILAVAKRINDGKSTMIHSVFNCDTDEFEVLFPCRLQLLEDTPA